MSIFDIGAAVIVVFAIALPERGATVVGGYGIAAVSSAPQPSIARLQAEWVGDPDNAAAAAGLADLLAELGEHDLALRVAGEAARRDGPAAWRAHLAVSSAHAERIEIEDAYEHARRALEVCGEATAACRAHERVRMELYVDELEAGIAAIEAGADPRLDPLEFRRRMAEVHPTARLRALPIAPPSR